MSEASTLMLLDLQDKEYEMHVAVRAVVGHSQAVQDIYASRAELNKWAEQLITFGKDGQGDVVFQYGTDDPKFYAKLRLTAFVYEASGPAALEIQMDNHSQRPFQVKSEFCIPCTSADLNRLGEMILDWDRDKNLMLEWSVAPQF